MSPKDLSASAREELKKCPRHGPDFLVMKLRHGDFISMHGAAMQDYHEVSIKPPFQIMPILIRPTSVARIYTHCRKSIGHLRPFCGSSRKWPYLMPGAEILSHLPFNILERLRRIDNAVDVNAEFMAQMVKAPSQIEERPSICYDWTLCDPGYDRPRPACKGRFYFI